VADGAERAKVTARGDASCKQKEGLASVSLGVKESPMSHERNLPEMAEGGDIPLRKNELEVLSVMR